MGITTIGRSAFSDCTSLALTELPARVTTIGVNAFNGCTSLALTELPAGVSTIGLGAFCKCTSLALSQLPAGVTTISENAFYSCPSLALTELPTGVTTIGRFAFYGCTSLALTELPTGVTTISQGAFEGCTSLSLKELPAGVITIEVNAFRDCTSLALTELPAGVTTIEDCAFKGCTSLALAELPAGITTIGEGAFSNATWCVKTEHYIPDGADGYKLVNTTKKLVKTGTLATADTIKYTPAPNDNEYLTKRLPDAYISHGNAIVLRRYYKSNGPTTVTITIKDDKGGSSTQEVPYGGTATEPELEPKPGHTLTWETEDGNPFDFDDPITGPVTIAPVWTPKEGTIHGTVVDQEDQPVPYAHVSVVAGNTNYLETDTDATGTFWVYNVPYGSYNAVATKRTITATSLLELDEAVAECKVILPDSQTNSILQVNQGTKDVVVGGLNTLFSSEIYTEADQAIIDAGGSVTVKMTVESVSEADIPNSAQQLNAAAATDGKTIFGYMEMDVSKISENAAGEITVENIPELPQLLQIIDPLSEEQKGRTGYVVYRMHGGKVYAITETPNENGAYITVGDDTLTIFASKFSDYCLAFDDPNANVKPEPTPPEGGNEKPTPIVTADDSSDDDGRHNPFLDVKSNDWFYDDVLDAYDAGYMEGITKNTFKPNSPLSRAQAAYTFAKVAEAELEGLVVTSDFEDVTASTTYATAITWANEAGVEIGYGNGKFGPNDSLTREQLALMLYRTYGNGAEVLTWEGDFTDQDDVSDWAEAAVRWAVQMDLLEGTDAGELLPQGTVTRAEAAALLLRVVELSRHGG